MRDETGVLAELIALTRSLADPARDLAILGEGNTSAQVDLETFLVKASGKEMRVADEDSFVAVSLGRALDVLEGPDLSDADVRGALVACKIENRKSKIENPCLPSVETFLHAYLLSLSDVNFVGHTHPAAVNSILCSVNSREAVSGRLFPDEI